MQRNFRNYKKQWISYSLTAALYLLTIYFLFFTVQLIPGTIATLGLIFVIHFSIISAQKYKLYVRKRMRLIWIAISSIILALTTTYDAALIILAYIIFHVGLFLLTQSKRGFLTNNVIPLPRLYCNVGMYFFTIFVTIAYGILMVGIVGNIPFDCDSIAASYDTIGSALTRPWDSASSSIQSRWDNSIMPGSNSTDGTFNQRLQEFENLALRDGIMTQREQINRNICLTVFENIQIQLQKPGFQAAILFPLFLILSPIIRLLLYIISGITLLVIEFFIKSKVYRKRKVMREVEEWY